MKTFVVSSSCWKILLFLSIHRDQITNSTSVCSPFICWFESIVNWVNQACKSWSAVQLVGEREGQVAHADTKVQTYLEYEHSATKWKAVSKTRRFLLHSWKPTLFFLWKESQHDVSYSCHMASDSETFAGTNGPKAVEHEREIYHNCWHFARAWNHARFTWAAFSSQKKFVHYSSHQFFEHMHRTLNTVEKITNYIV